MILLKIYDIEDPSKHVVQIYISDAKAVQDKILKIINNSHSFGTPCILGVNAVTTLNLLTQITSLNLRVPGDIGICGPDDWSWKNISIYLKLSIQGYLQWYLTLWSWADKQQNFY